MVRIWREVTSNYILYVPVAAWFTAQVLKTIINFFTMGTMNWKRLLGAGGMPSSHSALVCSLTIATARKYGMDSPLFAFAFLLGAIVMYDAMGVRRAAGEQAKVLNKMVGTMPKDDGQTVSPGPDGGKKLTEDLGHTPIEVMSGALLGILLAMIIPVR